jgi:hypothetical protein
MSQASSQRVWIFTSIAIHELVRTVVRCLHFKDEKHCHPTQAVQSQDQKSVHRPHDGRVWKNENISAQRFHFCYEASE